MAQILNVTPENLKRGMELADDIKVGERIIADAGLMLSGQMIALLRRMNLAEIRINVDDKPENELPPLEDQEISSLVDRISHAVMLYDDAVDDQLKIKRLIKNLTGPKEQGVTEAADFVLNFYDDVRARELAVESLENISDPQALSTVLTAARDEAPSVRNTALKLLCSYQDEFSIREIIAALETCYDEKIRNEIYDTFIRFDIKTVRPIVEKISAELDDASKLKTHVMLILQRIVKEEPEKKW